jgi:hypothetical protein
VRRGENIRQAPMANGTVQSRTQMTTVRGRSVAFRGWLDIRRVMTGQPSPQLTQSSSRRWTLPIVLEELSGVRERPMIIPMPTTARPQQRYEHRLRNLVQRTGDVTLATDPGVPRSTGAGVA